MTISVGIITRFRHKLLDNCLRSIVKQTQMPTNIIIVLHPHDQTSIDLVKNYSKTIKVKTYFHSKKGYAVQRNILLKKCKSDILYMVDDDCVLQRNNVKNIINTFKIYPQISAIQGKATNKDTGFYSQFMQWTYDLWIKRLNTGQNHLQSIDTKNVAFRARDILKNNFKFNECLGSEDVDFGLQISDNNLAILYSKNIFVAHNESTCTLVQFLLKKTRMKRGINLIKHKWKKHTIHVLNQEKNDYLTNMFNKSVYLHQTKYKIIFALLLFTRKLKI